MMVKMTVMTSVDNRHGYLEKLAFMCSLHDENVLVDALLFRHM